MSKQFFKYRFLIVFIAALSISTALFCLASLSLVNRAYPSSDQFPTSESRYLTPFNLQTSTPLQNGQLLLGVPSTPETPNAIYIATGPAQWTPLNPIQDKYRGLITNGERSELKVALTFDVCQAEGDLAGYDSEIVRVLNETQTPATFFLGGEWMRDHQTETLELAHNPIFELGNHSWSHQDFSTITGDEMKQEILLTQQFMYDLLGYQTNLFRLPYGTYNENALNVIGENGLYIIQWDIVSGDPDPNIDANGMTDWVLQQVQPGSIIIIHSSAGICLGHRI
jgi:peptidoglycan/xylan/chitin deacetylase (PgdA/CDA1 family)